MIKVPLFDERKINKMFEYGEFFQLRKIIVDAGYELKDEYDPLGLGWVWVEFETEAEAVEFKLKYL